MLIGSKTGEHMVVDTVCGDAIWQSESCRKVIGRLSESYRKVIGRFVAMPYGLWQCHRACGGYGCRVGFYRLLRFVRFCQLFSTFLNFSQLKSVFIGFYRVLRFVRFCQVLSSFGEPGLSLVHGELFPVFHLWVVRSTAHLEGASGCLIDH